MFTCSVCGKKVNCITNIHRSDNGRTRVYRLCNDCFIAYSNHQLNLSEPPRKLDVSVGSAFGEFDEDEEYSLSNIKKQL